MTIDNPPAFPVAWEAASDPGMTLRDWFAGQALPAVIAHGEPSPGVGTTFDMLAQDAYRFADAMLAERAKGQGDD